MKRASLLILLIAAFLGSGLTVASCMGEDPKGMELHDLLREGRRSLEAGDAGEAYNLFLQARHIAPNHPQALWGTVLSNDLLVWRNLTGIIDLLSGVYVKDQSLEACTEACERLEICDFFDEFNTTRERCVADCPWKLQPFMFEEVMAAPTCEDIYYGAAEWIIRTPPEECEKLCDSLNNCGLINPPNTYNEAQCVDNCPRMYVVRHSSCYTQAHLDTCNRFDRTCFEHTVLGIQILVDKLGDRRVDEQMLLADNLLERIPPYQYYLRYYTWGLREPEFEINLPGRFSKAELHLSKMLLHFWHFFVRFVVAQNLDINTVTFDQFKWNGTLCEQVLNDFYISFRNTLYDPIFPDALLLKEPHDESVANMIEAGDAVGHLFGELALTIEAMQGEIDVQEGRSVHYNDKNQNWRWDDDETWTVWDTGLELTKPQALEVHRIARLLEDNFLNETPIALDEFKQTLRVFDEPLYALVVDILKLAFEVETINPSYYFKHAQPEGLRPAGEDMLNAMKWLRRSSDMLPEFLGCGDLKDLG